jgi:hypothetical protein
VSGIFPVLSGVGVGLVFLLLGTQFVLTRRGGRRWTL